MNKEEIVRLTREAGGFDAACNFMVNEIKQLQRKYGDNVPLSTLLEHLTKESK